MNASARTIPALAQIPPGVVTLADHEAAARSRLDNNAWAYFSGGAGDEITLRANRSAWDGLQLLPRVLRPLAGGHTRIELLGRTLAHPVPLAPVAYQRLAHPDGELASAHAAAALGAGLVLSTQASVALETVAQAMLGEPLRGPLWFQLHMQPDRGFTRELVQRAEQAGYEALVLTVDAPTSGARDRVRRAAFRLPPHVSAVNLAGMRPPTRAALKPGQSALFDGLLSTAPTWADVAWLQAQTRLPVLLKGVLHKDDARQAAALGLAGLIVS
ncbi:MAG: alpha-hydroxy acid oxidase, partial [Burkholderiaceae bacterium]